VGDSFVYGEEIAHDSIGQNVGHVRYGTAFVAYRAGS